jgi:preprotein translocase subunit SecE
MEKVNRNPVSGIAKWFRETKNELKKVVWPNFEKIRKNTFIVLIYITIVGAVIWALDYGVFAPLLRLIVPGGEG